MKRASQKVREELWEARRKLLESLVEAVIPIEMRTPEMMKSVTEMIEKGSVLDGAKRKRETLTEDEATDIREKLKTAPYYLRDVLATASKKLPHHPGGRRKKFTYEQCLKIVEDISALVRGGMEPRAAKKQVAVRNNGSLSTIQRIWKLRSNYNAKQISASGGDA